MTTDGHDPERVFKLGCRNPSNIGDTEALIRAPLGPKVAEAVRAYRLAEENKKAILRLQLEAEKKMIRPKYR